MTIRTPKNDSEFKLKEKGSQFISYFSKAATVEEAEVILDRKKKQFYDATHNCYAYRIHNSSEKYSDDGEPNGTAGIRIMNVINKFDITNCIIVVTRYFGGTKLGVGPLGKAYYESALNSVNESNISILKEYIPIRLSFDFSLSSPTYKCLNDFDAKKITSNYEPEPNIECLIISSRLDDFKNQLTEMTKAKSKITKKSEPIFL